MLVFGCWEVVLLSLFITLFFYFLPFDVNQYHAANCRDKQNMPPIMHLVFILEDVPLETRNSMQNWYIPH